MLLFVVSFSGFGLVCAVCSDTKVCSEAQFGEKNVNPSAEDMAKFDAELTRLDLAHTFYTYPDANLALMAYTAQRHNEAAFELSWPRTLEFFDGHLKS